VMVDTIMPFTYFNDLLPRLAARRLPLELFYEQKANLSLARVLALKNAGVTVIQPGIEALATALLRRMNKGVQAWQNIMLLRYAGSAGLILFWNLLWGFPGDEAEAYEETLALLPLLRHLQPPASFAHVTIDRFSPYFDHPDRYGIRNIRPNGAYASAFPPQADVPRLAQWFTGEYACGAYRNPDVILKIHQEVAEWRRRWAKGVNPPSLKVVRRRSIHGEDHLLIDTRGLPGTQRTRLLDPAQVSVVLAARPYRESEDIGWAIGQKLGVVVDSWYVPLATASPELLMELEESKMDTALVATERSQ
ncbi:MAG: hypothetical protein AB7D39_20805, partial [Pseudodesulfovibrio sp.]|uniref:hypothetical protein n=1 Tax=Pseudodesulfovibrio sp. TaxID=2035812 RepID=UPI003D153252